MEPSGLNPRSGTARAFICSAPPCRIVSPVAQLCLARGVRAKGINRGINRSACRSKSQINKRSALPATSSKPSAPARSMQQTQITTRNPEAVASQIAPATADGPFKTATVPTAAKSGDGQKTDADTVAHLQRKISQMHVTVLELQQQVRYRDLAAPKVCTGLLAGPGAYLCAPSCRKQRQTLSTRFSRALLQTHLRSFKSNSAMSTCLR